MYHSGNVELSCQLQHCNTLQPLETRDLLICESKAGPVPERGKAMAASAVCTHCGADFGFGV